MAVRVTQTAIQVVTDPENVRVTQTAIQVVTDLQNVRVTQTAVQAVWVFHHLPEIACDGATTSAITIAIVPTANATQHEFFITLDAEPDPDVDAPESTVAGEPTSHVFAGLATGSDYYIVVRSTVDGNTYDSEVLHCQTAAAGAAPAYVSVSVTGATTATVYPEDVGAAATTVYYEWELDSEIDWTAPIGSTSKTGAGRFTLDITGLSTAVYKVRVRYGYAAGPSYWTEVSWNQNYTGLTAAKPGNFTTPAVPGWILSAALTVEWTLNSGWWATELADSTDGSSYSALASGSPLSVSSYLIDPTDYTEDDTVWLRVTATDGVTTTYFYTVLFVDMDGSAEYFGSQNCISDAVWNNATILGSGPVWRVPSTDIYTPCSIWSTNGGDATIILSPTYGIGPAGFIAGVGGNQAARGTTLLWWMNQEVEMSFWGLKYLDEDGNAWVEVEVLNLNRWPVTGSAGDLYGNANIYLNVREAGLSADLSTVAIISNGVSQGFFPPGPFPVDKQPHYVSLAFYRLDPSGAPEEYTYVLSYSGAGTNQFATGTVTVAGALPCGTVAPWVGRGRTLNFSGWSIIESFFANRLGICSPTFTPPSVPPGTQPFGTGGYPANPSKPCVVELTVYEADRTTEAWQATDDPADPASFQILLEPDNYGAQVVDFLTGSASLATVRVSLIDPPTITGDQDSGIMTGRLVDSLQRGAIMGRRARLRRYISPTDGWVTIVDGDALAPSLNASYSGFSFAIRDTRERERKTKAFQKATTTALLPRGVVRQGAGPFALGSYIPNIEEFPLTATFRDDGNHTYYFDLRPVYWSSSTTINSHRVIVMDDANEAARGRLYETLPFTGGANRAQHFIFPTHTVWWRPVGGTTNDWVKIRPRFEWLDAIDQIEITGFDSELVTYQGQEVRAARRIFALPAPTGIWGTTPKPADAPLPTVGDVCEVLVVYNGPPTDSLPFHWEGELGEGLRNAFDGEFSPKAPSPAGTYQADEYDPGVTVNTGIRYDAAVLATMTEPMKIRVKEPVPDVREYIEKYWVAPAGYAEALDNDGQVSPLHQRFPTSTVGLITIDNSIARAEPGWQQGETKINLIQYKYGRLFYSPVDQDGLPIGDIDGIVRQEVEIWYVAAGGNLPVAITGPEFLAEVSDSIALHGEQIHVIEGEGFLAVEALDIAFDPTAEQGWINAAERAATLLPRYAFGTPIIEVDVRRDATKTLRAGSWIGVDLSWMPDYATGRRGLQRYAQIFELPDLNCAWRRIRAELGEALYLRTYTGHGGGGSGGSAPYTSTPYVPASTAESRFVRRWFLRWRLFLEA